MTDSYNNILNASNTGKVKEIFSDKEGNLSIDKKIMQDIISNREIIKGKCKK